MGTDQAIILFDGVCNLCTWSVQFILKRDPHGYFKFASMQSACGRKLMEEHGVASEAMDTFILIQGPRCLTQSDAAIEVAKHLSGYGTLLRVLSVIPKPVRDRGYAMIANNRYRWFGKQDTCMVPSRDVLDRFLS
jgi:predicted DCC family thiol-disulfide oxidoreductase YuxK